MTTLNKALKETVKMGLRTEAEAIELQKELDVKNEYRAKSDVQQNAAWELKHKAETAYQMGDFELAGRLNESYETHTQNAIYYTQLAAQ